MEQTGQIWGVLVAAGQGQRFGHAKALVPLAGRPMLAWSIRAFEHSAADGLVVVAREEDLPVLSDWSFRGRPLLSVAGGVTRQDSVAAGLRALPHDADRVVVHDAARPLVTAQLIDQVAASPALATMPTVAVADTLRRSRRTTWTTIDRQRAYQVQTPQAFLRSELTKRLGGKRSRLTDEAELFAEKPGELVSVPGDPANLKITVLGDLALAEALLAHRQPGPSVRVGHGYDVHRLRLGPGPLKLGGVSIFAGLELVGHSDGDVLLHAVADAVLGGAGLADIGHYFPPGRPETAGMDSGEIVRAAVAQAKDKGFEVVQTDITLAADAPRLSPHRDAIRREVARLLGIGPAQVGLKATTEEGLVNATSGLGVKVWAVALLRAAR